MSFKVYAELLPGGRSYAPEVVVSASVSAAQAAGRPVIEQTYRIDGHASTRTLEEITLPETLTMSTHVRGVAVRNHTASELGFITRVLERLPLALLARFNERYNGIVCVDWTGSGWRDATHPNPGALLNGGANMTREITRDGVVESGTRIELTHTSLVELRPSPYGRRGVFTLWHELGHAAYRARFTPRTVERHYGDSIHTGGEEQPAYAFMWYFLNPGRLSQADRDAFDDIFQPHGETAEPSVEVHRPRLSELFPLSSCGDESWSHRGWRRPGTTCIHDSMPGREPELP